MHSASAILIWIVLFGHLLVEMELENLLLDFVFNVSTLFQCERFLALFLHDFVLQGVNTDSGQENLSVALLIFLS